MVDTGWDPWHYDLVFGIGPGEEGAAQITNSAAHGSVERFLSCFAQAAALEHDAVRHSLTSPEKEDVPGSSRDERRSKAICLLLRVRLNPYLMHPLGLHRRCRKEERKPQNHQLTDTTHLTLRMGGTRQVLGSHLPGFAQDSEISYISQWRG
jgi:hypothetical protein